MPNKLDLAAYIAILSALTVATLRLGNFFQLAGLSVFTGWATATTLTGGQVYAASRLAAGGRGLADSERIAEQIASADDEILEIARQRNEAVKREERLMLLLEHTAPAARSPGGGVETTDRSQHLAPWHCEDCGKSGSEAVSPSIRQRAYAGHRKSCPARLQEGRIE